MYSARTEDDLALKCELDGLTRDVRYYLSHEKNPAYCHGRITEETIEEAVPDFRERDIYICGPEAMTRSIYFGLKGKGIKQDRIHFELFAF